MIDISTAELLTVVSDISMFMYVSGLVVLDVIASWLKQAVLRSTTTTIWVTMIYDSSKSCPLMNAYFLQDAILPLSTAAMALPPLAIRGDLGVLSTAGLRYAPSLVNSFIKMGPQGALGATKLLRPFSEIMDSLALKEPFVRNWIDLLCFLLAGVKSNGALSAEIVSMTLCFH